MRGSSSLWKSKKTAAITAVAIVLLPLSSAFFIYPKKADAALTAACTAAQAVAAASSAAAAAAALSVPTFDSAVFAQTSIINASTASLTVKECILDGILVIIGKTLIKQISNSIITWINSGFNGSPTFVSNPGQFFQGVGDAVAGQFIEELGFGFLCEPFKLDLRLSLAFEYGAGGTSRNEIGCTLSDVIGNVEGFLDGDFTQGGWDQWLNITARPNNNKYGAYLNARAEIDARISHAQGIESMKLGWGKGFFSLTDSLGNILTPGATIETQLGDLVGSDLRQLELADEINEIVGAFIGQLTSQLLSGGGIARGSGSGYPTGGAATAALTDPDALDIQNGFDPYTGSIIDPTGGGGGPNPNPGPGPTTQTNLARAHASQARMSSERQCNPGTGFRDSADNAADGNTDPVWNSNTNRMACTDSDFNPWWEMDMEGVVNIADIHIYRRAEAAISPNIAMGDFRVFVNTGFGGCSAFSSTFNVNQAPFVSVDEAIIPGTSIWASSRRQFSSAASHGLNDIYIKGSCVRVQRIDSTAPSDTKRLMISEVQIWENRGPRITLNDPTTTIVVPYNSSFTDPGAVATDPDDGVLTYTTTIRDSSANILPSIPTNVPGTYTIRYTAVDRGGVEGTAQRTVRVENQTSS